MAASSSRGRSSSPFNHRRPSSPHSSSSSSSSFMSTRIVPRLRASSSTSHYGSGNGYSSRSMTPGLPQTDSVYSKGYGGRSPVDFASADELLAEELDAPRSGGDSISVTIRFRPLSEREYQRGDEIAWYADGDKIVRNEYNLATAYAFDRVFGPSTITEEVYEVAARPVVKAAMEGVNGTVFAYGVTSSGKTHTMHGDQNSPGIIPLAIKDVFSIIQDTPGQEFLLRVSYLEIYNEVINDLLDPTGQNLRVREDAQGTYVEGIKEEVVLSPGHALSFIAAGEEHRHVGSNNFNLFSSRSHTIFTLMIESSAHGDEYDGVVFSQLNLIDLAGSESSKTETTGLRRKEGAYINKSLLTLGTVIGKLSEGKASHVPYRDSKLTRLLQSSLSGHGHVSLICTITPASSNMEETHNTLKFASRAKCVEIFASRNKIIDEKSLIKKYQREISSLKLELDQLKKGILVGVSHEEVISLRQQLEEGQVKMQSRLEEEEEAKAALMSRIQRLTKLILVSTKNTIPGCLNDVPNHQRRHSVGEDDKLDVLRDGSFLIGSENHKEFSSSALAISSDPSNEFKHTRSSNKWNDELSPAGSTVTESTQGGIAMSDQMDLLVEQVKMLGGEIAFSTSTLKRLVEQSVTDPVSSKTQIQNLEHEIQEKRRQMRVLEQRIMESGEASTANGSLIDMQQKVMKLMTQCNEKSFELEITSADNRILQEQLQNKCAENKELQEKINLLDQQLASGSGGKSSSSEQCISEEYVDELRKKIKSQEIENEKLQLEHVHILEKNSGLHVQNQKLSEEASYAKELASAAAVELKNLAGEVTKLSLHNAKLEKELLAAQELAHSRGAGLQTGSGGNRKYSDSIRPGRKGRLSGRANEVSRMVYSELDSWDLDPDDLKMELQARKQREAALEAALAEKDFFEEEYRKRAEEAKKRETALENDLANMWVLVAQLKKEGGAIPELSTNERQTDGINHVNDPKIDDVDSKNNVLKERQVTDVTKPAQDVSKEESLVLRLKARLQEMKEKELKYSANGDANSHVEQLHKIFKLCGSPSEEYWRKSKLPHATIFKPQQPYRRCVTDTFKDFPAQALELMETLLSIDPADRGSAASALHSEFFTTKPLPCNPSSLPKYPPSKEFDAKVRDEEARRQAAAGNKGHRYDPERRGGRESRAVPAPDANAELALSMQKRQGHANSKSRSEKFNPNQEEVASGFPIDPPRPSQAIEEASIDPHEHIHKRASHSGPLVHRAAWSKAVKNMEEAPKISTGADLSMISSLVSARNLLSEDRREKSGPSQQEVQKLIRFPGSFKEASESMIKQDQKIRTQSVAGPHQNEDERTSSKDPVLLGYGSKGNKIHYSGPLLVPSGKMDQMLKDHDRHVQEAVRRARLDKAKARKVQVEGNQLPTNSVFVSGR